MAGEKKETNKIGDEVPVSPKGSDKDIKKRNINTKLEWLQEPLPFSSGEREYHQLPQTHWLQVKQTSVSIIIDALADSIARRSNEEYRFNNPIYQPSSSQTLKSKKLQKTEIEKDLELVRKQMNGLNQLIQNITEKLKRLSTETDHDEDDEEEETRADGDTEQTQEATETEEEEEKEKEKENEKEKEKTDDEKVEETESLTSPPPAQKNKPKKVRVSPSHGYAYHIPGGCHYQGSKLVAFSKALRDGYVPCLKCAPK